MVQLGFETHPSSVFDELLPINLVQPRYTNVIALGLYKPGPQLLIFAAHCIQHHLGCWLQWVQGNRRDSRLDGRQGAAAVRVDSLLLRQSQCRYFSGQPIHMRLRFSLQGIFEVNLLLS